MGKKLFSLLSIYYLFGCLIANPTTADVTKIVSNKEVMASCAIKYLEKYPIQFFHIDRLFENKPQLVRQVSDDVSNKNINLCSDKHAQILLKILINEYCPVLSPKVTPKKHCPVPSPSPQKKKCKKFDETGDCGVPVTTPPPSPVTKRAEQQVDRLHRQWTTKWKSDSDLQSMLQNSLSLSSLSSIRKRTLSDVK